MSFLNRCIWTPVAGGLADFVVSAAAQNGYTPAQCLDPLVIDGALYHYFTDPTKPDHEEGDGVYTVSTTTLTRATIRNSSNAGAKVNFSSPPIVVMGGLTVPDVGDAICVKSFGAKGDGATDDTVAIAAAIASLSPGGGTVLLMSGGAVHNITAAINLPNNVNLIGGGAGSLYQESVSPPLTTIKYVGSAGSGRILDCDPTHQRYSGTIQGILFNANYRLLDGIWLRAAQGATLRDVVVVGVAGGDAIWIDIGTYPYPASEIVFERVHTLNLGTSTTGLLATNMSGCSFYGCHFDGGLNGRGVWVKDNSDTNAFYSCSMGCYGASGIAYSVEGAGFNNNVFSGSIQTADGLGTEVQAASNQEHSHLWGVYLAYGATLYTDGGSGYMHFHDCVYLNNRDRQNCIGVITITSTVDWINTNPFTIELQFWGTFSAITRIRNGLGSGIGVNSSQVYILILDPGDGVNITHSGLTASAMPH